MSTTLRLALGKLLQAPEGLASSQLSVPQRRALDEFARQTSAITSQPRGRGVIYQVALPAVVAEHWRALVPNEELIGGGMPVRASNLAKTRSTKGLRHHHDIYYLLLKSTSDASWCDREGHSLCLPETTLRQGAAALAIDNEGDRGWHSQHTLWLVENQALFDRLDWLPTNEPTTIAYYGGHLRNALLHWLASERRACHINFFPDYDGVGLLNFARIKEQLGEHVSFWLMPEWQARIQRFGSNSLWQDTAREFQAALPRLSLAAKSEVELFNLIQLMQQKGLALEQEAVWL